MVSEHSEHKGGKKDYATVVESMMFCCLFVVLLLLCEGAIYKLFRANFQSTSGSSISLKY